MTSRRATCTPRGFTLVELMIASTISLIVIAGGVALMLSQQRMYYASAGERGLQETARIALGDLGTNLRRAGFGVDPPLALDFGPADNLWMSQSPPIDGVTVKIPSPSYRCGAAITCRDRIDGPDEIVFYARSPVFGHRLTSVTSATTIAISGPLAREPLYAGQVLQLICDSNQGGEYWAYVTVAKYVPLSAAATVAVTLATGSGGGQLDFPFQQGVLDNTAFNECFKSGSAFVTKVDRYRYYVASYSAQGAVVDALTADSRPCLMLDQGLSDNAGRLPHVIVTPDVEDLQFAYQYPVGAVTLVGATANEVIASGPAGIDLAPATGAPGYGTAPDDAGRATQHPANIRGVRVSVVVRSSAPDVNIADDKVPAAGNRPEMPGLPHYRRMRVETTIATPNLDSRAPYFPVYSTNSGADQYNLGGG